MDLKKIIESVGCEPLSGATCPNTIGFVEINTTQNYGFGSSPSNRKNVGWKIAEHIVMEPQPADIPSFIKNVWRKCTDADPRRPCTQILYVPTPTTSSTSTYTAFDASGNIVKSGPLSSIFPWAEMGFPRVGEFVRIGFRQLEELGGLDAIDLMYLTSPKSAVDFKTAGYPVLKVSDGSSEECYDEGRHLRYYPKLIFEYLGTTYRLTKELKIHSYLSFFSYFVSKGVDMSKMKLGDFNGELGPLQKIVYGAPGTGKSFGTDDALTDEHGNAKAVVFRTTFHPDSDYSTFVGAYKPMMDGNQIVYSFRSQAFIAAYVKAWRMLARKDEGTLPVALVIEEINRGNCAQIFGELFQLLDRDDDTGFSTYPIVTDVDLAKWFKEESQFGVEGLTGIAKPTCIKQADWDLIVKGEMLALPPNLYIWATMNTSDQSLFPIDSAFKRRWDWQYVPIAKPDTEGKPDWKERKIIANGKAYDWWDFITIINEHISDITKSEDKQLGYFFVKAPDATGEISADRFANKVLFYLYNDVFKDWDLPEKIFGTGMGNAKFAFKDFFYCEKGTAADGKPFSPGDVRADRVAEFIEHQKNAKGDSVDSAVWNPPADPMASANPAPEQ